MIGAPPGYIGYEEGGQLTEKIRRRPYSVILLDEIEKAHPDVFNILLQLMEEGRLTDSFGRKVDFRNTIVIMTSNVGAELVRKAGIGIGTDGEEADYEKLKQKLLDANKKVFRPEFLNRVDDIIVFHPLTRQDLEQIINIELEEVKGRLREKNMELELSAEVNKFLIDKGYDPVYGARPLKRVLQRYVENVLAEEILSGKFVSGDKIRAELRGETIQFEKSS